MFPAPATPNVKSAADPPELLRSTYDLRRNLDIMSQPDPLSWTLLFKKHRTTVLLLLPPSHTIEATKTKLLEALQARGLKEINGDPVPEDPTAIEFGVAVDKNDLEKGWTSLEAPKIEADDAPKQGPEKKATSISLKAAELNNGQSIAFRFRKTGVASSDNATDLDLEDPGWDVVIPKFDDEEVGS